MHAWPTATAYRGTPTRTPDKKREPKGSLNQSRVKRLHQVQIAQDVFCSAGGQGYEAVTYDNFLANL